VRTEASWPGGGIVSPLFRGGIDQRFRHWAKESLSAAIPEFGGTLFDDSRHLIPELKRTALLML